MLPSTLALKYTNPCGFSIDNLEFASLDSINLETSFEPKVIPGIKLGFVSSKTGNLGVVYKHKFATITTDLDVGNFNSLQSSILSGISLNNVQIGGSIDFSLKNKEFDDYSAGLAWVPKEGLFAGIQANDKFSTISTSLQYQVSPKLNIASLIDFTPKTISESMKVAIGAEYEYCSGITLKTKTDNNGIINASIKKKLDNFVVVAAIEVNSKDLKTFNFGINTTIG